MLVRKKDWNLTQEAFEQLLSRLGADPTAAARKYEDIRKKLLKLFQWRGCSNPLELADETLDRVARKIQEGSPMPHANIYVYIHGVALNVIRECWRSPEQRTQSLDDPASNTGQTPDNSTVLQAGVVDDKESQLACLDRCLEQLAAPNRHLLLAYHRYERRARIDARRELAQSLNIPVNALRIRVHRIRTEVEICVRNCLGSGSN